MSSVRRDMGLGAAAHLAVDLWRAKVIGLAPAANILKPSPFVHYSTTGNVQGMGVHVYE